MTETDDSLNTRITGVVEDLLLPDAPETLRAVVAWWNARRIRLVCYLDGDISEDMRTALHHAGSHIMGAFLGDRRVFVEVQQLNRPTPIPEPEGDAAFIVYEAA